MKPSLLRLLAATACTAGPAGGTEDLFLEMSRQRGLDFVHENGMAGEYYMVEINSGGAAVLDYDGDGDLDLYLVQGQPLQEGRVEQRLTDRLYRNDLTVSAGATSQRFVDRTAEAAIVPAGYGMGAASADYDDDGDADLYVTNLGGNRLLRNGGDGTFTDVTVGSGADDRRWSVPAVFFDYDRDGHLDLFVGNYLDFSFKTHKICRTATGARDYCGPSAFPGVPDSLFHNRGDGTFEDVSLLAGPGRVSSKSLGAVAEDFNGDGRLDLYVANDGTANQMWIQGPDGRWSDEALINGTAVNCDGWPEASMGVDAADFDADGDPDLFMTHLVSETNTLFRNDGEGFFEDATKQSGLALPSWGATSWGTAWVDYDNDGWLDLFVASGAVRVIEKLARLGDPFPFHEPNQLFHNLGGGRFEEISGRSGAAFALSEVSRAAAFGDLDNDGDVDVLVANNSGPARLLVNRVGSRRPWLGLRLIGGGGGDRLGSRVGVDVAGRPTLWRRVRTDGSFAAASDPRLLFGLGEATRVERARIAWPSGRTEEWRGLPLERYSILRERRRPVGERGEGR